MVAGLQEILLLIVIAMAIILLPRITNRGAQPSQRSHKPRLRIVSLTGRQRLVVVTALLWPTGVAFYLTPWRNGWQAFLMVGIGPVVVAVCVFWVVAGFKVRKKK